ncbi:MAG: 2,3-bisphosphoglycerate-independent phosphoglycerate mutase, partial [Pseudomonadota bacterium]
HILAAGFLLSAMGVAVAIHAITDGRDVGPKTAVRFVAELADRLPEGAQIVTVIGRYYAMDRDNRWERVSKAFEAMARGSGETAASAPDAVAQSYAAGTTDEFILPTAIGGFGGMADGDGLFCLNFRADRAREILAALCAPGFDGFDTGTRPQFAAQLGMVEYSEAHNAYLDTAFPKREITNTIGEWVSKQGLTQYRLAETEKYPHVTFFLNGGAEAPYPGEARFMPPSPKVATYDLQPEMSASEVTEKFVEAIHHGYDLIVTNYANPDMVGHTGDLAAARAACEAVDQGLGQVVAALEEVGGAMVVCADHGNCEVMVDPETGGPHTAHTLNPVPVILFGGPEGAQMSNGRLADLAPTLLQLMGLETPPEMTGQSLIRGAGS